MTMTSDAEVYRKYADELIRFGAALVGPSGAEDLLAGSVLRALASPRWPEVENKRAYLYRVLFNEATRARRDATRRMERELRAAPGEAVDGAISGAVVDRDVIAALLRLSVRQRAVVFLTYWADLPPADVAVLLDSSPRTVERELSAAKRRLEELLS